MRAERSNEHRSYGRHRGRLAGGSAIRSGAGRPGGAAVLPRGRLEGRYRRPDGHQRVPGGPAARRRPGRSPWSPSVPGRPPCRPSTTPSRRPSATPWPSWAYTPSWPGCSSARAAGPCRRQEPRGVCRDLRRACQWPSHPRESRAGPAQPGQSARRRAVTLASPAGTSGRRASRCRAPPPTAGSWSGSRPCEAHTLSADPDQVRLLPQRLQELLGFNQPSPYLGFINGRHPREWLMNHSRGSDR